MTKTTKTTKPVIMFPVWPGRSGAEFFGWRWGDWRGMEDCVSCWINLRLVDKGDRWSPSGADEISNLGVYVWIARDGSVSLDLRLHDVHSLTLREAERQMKTFKRLHAKVSKAYESTGSYVKTQRVFVELLQFFAALGVTEAVEYHGIGREDTYCRATSALAVISEEIERQIERQGGWKAAA